MIDTEILISIFVNDNVEMLNNILARDPFCLFHINSKKYKYPSLFYLCEGAPLISMAAYFGSYKCYLYLADTEANHSLYKINIFCFACAGGNFNIIRDISSRFPICLDFSIYYNQELSFRPGYNAILYNKLDVVKYLTVKGYAFHKDEILLSSFYGYEDIVDFFINGKNVEINTEYFYFYMVKRACLGMNLKVVQKLMTNYGFKKLSKGRYQELINISIEKGDLSLLKFLIKNSSDVFPRVFSSLIQPSLVHASKFEHLDVINFLINQGGKLDDIEDNESPLVSALMFSSTEIAQFYLEHMSQIPTEKVISLFEVIFSNFYSFSKIQLLLQYINKSLFEFKEHFARLAIEQNTSQFFNDLVNNKISLDFLKIELFDDHDDKFQMFEKLYELGAPFQFDVSNKVFLNALKKGNSHFVFYAISKGAILNDEIIQVSNCLQEDCLFYKQEKLVELLYIYNIDLSRYPKFIDNIINCCQNKTSIYEKLAMKAMDFGAIITESNFKKLIEAKWFLAFQKATKRIYFNVNVTDIALSECKFYKHPYQNILEIIFTRQPELVDHLIQKIEYMQLDSNISRFVVSYKHSIDLCNLNNVRKPRIIDR